MDIPPPEIIRVKTLQIACDGSGDIPAALGHPRVFLRIEPDTGFVECGYCDRRFVLEGGVADTVRFKLLDYRQEPGQYDRIVSVGMFEHVGVAHFVEFFTKVKQLLNEDGVMLLHAIGRMEPPGATNTWLRKYIFPGGYTPAMSEVLAAIEKVGLWVTDIEVLRLHYAETLRHWRQGFLAAVGVQPRLRRPPRSRRGRG